jgi:hypothetical protein
VKTEAQASVSGLSHAKMRGSKVLRTRSDLMLKIVGVSPEELSLVMRAMAREREEQRGHRA